MQRTISVISSEPSLQQVTSDSLQWANSATSNKQILQRAISAMSNEWFYKEQRVTSEFWMSYWIILQGVTNDFAASNKLFYNK